MQLSTMLTSAFCWYTNIPGSGLDLYKRAYKYLFGDDKLSPGIYLSIVLINK